jgi:hypothetical protein
MKEEASLAAMGNAVRADSIRVVPASGGTTFVGKAECRDVNMFGNGERGRGACVGIALSLRAANATKQSSFLV